MSKFPNGQEGASGADFVIELLGHWFVIRILSFVIFPISH